MGILIALALAAQDPADVECALGNFQADYAAEAEADRAQAVERLGEIHHPRILAKLTSLLGSDGPAVRIAAARALGRFHEHAKPASGALVAALPANAKNDDVQVALFDALASLGEPGAMPALHAFFEHKTLRLARAAVEAAGKAGRRESIDALIALLARHEKVLESNKGGGVQVESDGLRTYTLEDSENSARRRAETLAPAAGTALRAITKQEIRAARDWAAWWAKERQAPARTP